MVRVRLQTIWKGILNDVNRETGLSWKSNFWPGIVICAILVFTNPATSSTLHDENGNNELQEFYLSMNKTPMEFHNLIEKLEYTNHTDLFTAPDKNGATALHRAVEEFPVLNQTLDILKAHHVDFNALDEAGNSAFFNAVQYGTNAPFLATLLSYGMEWNKINKNNDTALHVAALYGNLEAVSLLLSMGSDVNAPNLLNRTPLHQAVLPNNSRHNIVKFFFSTTDNTNASEICGKAVFHLSAGNNSSQPIFTLIRVLIENHADVNAVDNDDNTALHYVAMSCTPAVLHKTVMYLDSINNTKSFTMENNGFQSLLFIAVWKMEVENETLAILQRRGVDFKEFPFLGFPILPTAIVRGRSETFIRNLIAFGADWRQKDHRENTALHFATPSGNLDALKLFIQLGADVNALNYYGATPLHSAFGGELSVTTLEIIREIVTRGANGNIRTEGGNFPIDLAQRMLEWGGKLDYEIMEFLENMKTRPSFNGSDVSNGSFNRTGKVISILDELEQLASNDNEIRRIIIKMVRTEVLTQSKAFWVMSRMV